MRWRISIGASGIGDEGDYRQTNEIGEETHVGRFYQSVQHVRCSFAVRCAGIEAVRRDLDPSFTIRNHFATTRLARGPSLTGDEFTPLNAGW